MKTVNILLVSLAVLVMMSCKKDGQKPLEVKSNGLSYTEAYMTLDTVKTTATKFLIGDKIKLNVNGCKGFVEKDSMVYIGASLTVYDMDNKEVMNYPDLFSDYDATGVTPDQAETVKLYLTIGDPMKKGESYIWKNRIWDKNGKGEITSEIGIKVKE